LGTERQQEIFQNGQSNHLATKRWQRWTSKRPDWWPARRSQLRARSMVVASATV
jgi:hypothetical protein